MNNLIIEEALAEFFNESKEMPRFATIEQTCEAVTQHLIEKYGLSCPKHINSGYCFIWAYLVWALFPQVKFVSTWGHVVVKYNGKYYDSQNPDGRINLNDIRWMHEEWGPVEQDVVAMCVYWSRNGTQSHLFRQILRNIFCFDIFQKISQNNQWECISEIKSQYEEIDQTSDHTNCPPMPC